MKRLPVALGALALALTTGAVAGKSMSTEPLGASADISAMLPERRTISQPRQLARAEPLPDHYDLVTPDGTIEVSELAWHGRYRDRYRQFNDVPTDEDLFRYDPPSDRYASASANTSAVAVALDAAQPDPRPAPAIAQLDAAQGRYAQRAEHIARAAERTDAGRAAPERETAEAETVAVVVTTGSPSANPPRVESEVAILGTD